MRVPVEGISYEITGNRMDVDWSNKNNDCVIASI